MKVYVITIDEAYDFEKFNHAPEVFRVFDDARRRFEDIVALAKTEFKDCGWEESQGDNFYEAWEEGYWATNHYSVTVHTVELQ